VTRIGVPPKLVRRLVLAPLVALIDLAILLASPLLTLLGALASPLTGGAWRPLRIVAITVNWAARHLLGMLSCLGLWASSGLRGGRDREHAHHDVLRRYVAAVNRTSMRVARIDVRVCDSERAEDALTRRERPVVVLSRHAGEGDSLLVLHALMCRYGRRPRVVLHEALRLDPLLDVLGERLAYRFIDPRGGDIEGELAAMASTLSGDGAVLIFPEGGNFSPQRRRRAINRLVRGGHDDEAAQARAMEHVAAPRPGGALVALEAAPDADAIFVGHVGIPAGIANLWRQLLAPSTVRLRMWHVAAGDIPGDRDEQIEWLFACWSRLDAWVDEQQALV
jgi:1-acyl-sn-glycerol-3-phosphate acyltransferase